MDIRFSPNLFLEVAELNRLKSSLSENGWKRFAKNFVSNFGICKNKNNTYFFPLQSGTTETIAIQSGIAFDSDMNAIVLEKAVEFSVPKISLGTNEKYWFVLKYDSTHWEKGTISISSTGTISGINTQFLEVLRSQPNFPTKIVFESSVNLGEYEVVSIDSDTSAVLAGDFVPENDIRYAIVGTFTPGYIPSNEDRFLYTYDSCSIEKVTSVNSPVLIYGKEFLIASVDYIGNVMNIVDYRNYNLLDTPIDYSDVNQAASGVDQLVTLTQTNVVSINDKGIVLECILQHGMKINSFEITPLSTGYSMVISGVSNYITTEDTIPNGFFKGWKILNRLNMQYCEVSDSVNNTLTIINMNSDAVADAIDMVLIPPYIEIEYQVTASNNVVNTDIPYKVRCSFEDINNRIFIPIYWKDENEQYADSVTLTFKYRLIDKANNLYIFQPFNVASYIDHEGNQSTISNSTISVNVTEIKPVPQERNYS